MAVRIVRLGAGRLAGEGVRIGTVRHPPRGVPKEKWAAQDFFDVWLPELSPGAEILSQFRAGEDTPGRREKFMAQFTREMEKPPASRIIQLLAALSRTADFSVGCYCEDESHCHRLTLREILARHGAVLAK